MNRPSLRAACAALVVLLGACSATSIQHDWDQQFDFSPLKTWSWGEQRKGEVPDDLAARRVATAVESQLAAQGYQKVESGADFQVVWQVRSREKVRVTESGYRDPYAAYWTGYYGPRSVDVNYYEEGSLIIDAVDPKEDRIIWRGIATRALSNNPTPDKSNEMITDAVRRIFSGFPPKD